MKNYYKKLVILIVILLMAFLVVWLYLADFSKGKEIEFGVTFSQKYATDLEQNWREVYLAILDQLGVRNFRLITYWDQIEKEPGVYDFSDIIWQLRELEKRGGTAVLAIGNRVPRWPECHWPSWIYNYSDTQRNEKILAFLTKTVAELGEFNSVTAWQVENEPFLEVFGECPKLDREFYDEELELIKSLDNRPIVITESGELSTWLNGGRRAEMVGTSIYRIVWNKWFGYFYYPLPPAHYYLKAELVKILTGVDKVFVSEMQMEPWVSRKILLVPLAEQSQSMNAEKFDKNLEYAKRTGLSPIHLWGAEWWYWLAKQGDDSLWETAKEIWLTK